MVVMATEDEIIRRRLLFDGDGSGDEKRITTLLKTIVKWSTSECDEEERTLTFHKILALLSQCEYYMSKHHLVYLMNIKERANYEKLFIRIEEEIVQAKEDIISCKEELKRAKEIKRNKQEYDALAKVIEQQPERKRTEQELKTLTLDMTGLDEEREKLMQKLELRKKQFHTLIYSIQLMQAILEADETTEEAAAAKLQDLDSQEVDMEDTTTSTTSATKTSESIAKATGDAAVAKQSESPVEEAPADVSIDCDFEMDFNKKKEKPLRRGEEKPADDDMEIL